MPSFRFVAVESEGYQSSNSGTVIGIVVVIWISANHVCCEDQKENTNYEGKLIYQPYERCSLHVPLD